MWSECPDETRNGSQLPKKNTARVSSYVYRSLSVRNSRAKDKTNLCLTGRTRGVSFWKPKKLPLIANVTSSPSTLYSSPSTLLSKSITLAVWLSAIASFLFVEKRMPWLFIDVLPNTCWGGRSKEHTYVRKHSSPWKKGSDVGGRRTTDIEDNASFRNVES